jgi:hypothetical protein
MWSMKSLLRPLGSSAAGVSAGAGIAALGSGAGSFAGSGAGAFFSAQPVMQSTNPKINSERGFIPSPRPDIEFVVIQ